MLQRAVMILVSFIQEKFGPAMLADFTLETLRKFVAATSVVVISILVMGLSLGAVMIDMVLSSYDQNQLVFSKASVAGGLIFLLGCGGIALALRRKVWKLQPVAKDQTQASELADAITHLINEFIMSRNEERRQRSTKRESGVPLN